MNRLTKKRINSIIIINHFILISLLSIFIIGCDTIQVLNAYFKAPRKMSNEKAAAEAPGIALVEEIKDAEPPDDSETLTSVAKPEESENISNLRILAEQGNAEAQFYLGVCYETGNDVQKDYNEAVKWYRMSAEKGKAEAQCNLGVCNNKGNGVQQDYSEAVNWYRKAAEQGNACAQCNLGLCYSFGYGVQQSWTAAVKWFRKAAAQGYYKAQFHTK